MLLFNFSSLVLMLSALLYQTNKVTVISLYGSKMSEVNCGDLIKIPEYVKQGHQIPVFNMTFYDKYNEQDIYILQLLFIHLC